MTIYNSQVLTPLNICCWGRRTHTHRRRGDITDRNPFCQEKLYKYKITTKKQRWPQSQRSPLLNPLRRAMQCEEISKQDGWRGKGKKRETLQLVSAVETRLGPLPCWGSDPPRLCQWSAEHLVPFRKATGPGNHNSSAEKYSHWVKEREGILVTGCSGVHIRMETKNQGPSNQTTQWGRIHEHHLESEGGFYSPFQQRSTNSLMFWWFPE